MHISLLQSVKKKKKKKKKKVGTEGSYWLGVGVWGGGPAEACPPHGKGGGGGLTM